MTSVDYLIKLSGWLQIAIVIFGVLTPTLAFLKWKVDRKLSSIKDLDYAQKISRLSPRNLSPEQKRILINKLTQGKGRPVALASRMMDGESADFADEIASIFKEAGWDVGPTNRTSLNDFTGFLSMFVTGDNLDKDAFLIAKAFQEAGIECHPEKIQEGSISGQLANKIYVVVGRKRL